jgi:hypothetical protein
VGFSPHLHQIATAGLAQTARQVTIYKDARFSDHAPLTIQYDVALWPWKTPCASPPCAELPNDV